MRVVQVNSVFGRGSTGRIVAALHDAIRGAGGSAFAATSSPEISDSSHHKIGGQIHRLEHGLETRLLDRHGLASRRPTRELTKYLADLAPDVVHLHNIHGYYLNYELLFDGLRRLDVPIVWTLHDSWGYTGHCAYYLARDCRKWLTGCGRCPETRSYPASWGVDRSAVNWLRKESAVRDLDVTIVTPSRWLAEDCSRSMLGRFSVTVIANDVDGSVFAPRRTLAADECWGAGAVRKFLAVAPQWDERKGHAALRDFATKMRSGERLVVVGALTRGRDFDVDGVVHIPYTENTARLAELYSSADLFLNPTMEDNYPTTNLEALSCGTPVATFVSGGSAEVLDRGPGVAIHEKTGTGLRKGVDVLLGGPSVPGVRVSTKRWDVAQEVRMEDKYLDLYRSLLGPS